MAFANTCLDLIGANPRQLQSVSIGQGTEETVRIKLFDNRTNSVVNLAELGVGTTESSSTNPGDSLELISSSWVDVDTGNKHGVEIVIKDMPNGQYYRAKMADVASQEDAEQGIVTFTANKAFSFNAGVFLAMAVVWNHGTAIRLYPFYFNVNPNLKYYNPAGPLTVYEVRMAIRDTCPEANFLIDSVEFTDIEIHYAITRPIDYWNEVPPPIRKFTYQTFPFRYHWTEAVIGELLIMAATWLRRNDLDYSAGGVSVADTKKWPDYMRMGQERLTAWKKFVHDKKIEINIEGGYGTLTGWRALPYR